jgi:hemerythrin superfamily protein
MNAIDLLMLDHRKVEKLFSEFQKATTERRRDFLCELDVRLTAHMEAEESAFYPVLQAHASRQVSHSVQEHSHVRALLEELRNTDVDRETFEKNFVELMKSVEEHIREEEAPGGLMVLAHHNLSEQTLSEISEHIEEIKMKRGDTQRSPAAERLPRAS